MNLIDILWGSDSKTEPTGVYLWRRVFLDLLNKDSSFVAPARSFSIYHDTKGLYSGKKKVTYIYTIDTLPRLLPVDFRNKIRSAARGNASVSFVEYMYPKTIEWGSARMKAKINTWKDIDSEDLDLDAYSYRENIGKLDERTWRQDSMTYLIDAENRGCRFFDYTSYMILTGERGSDFDEADYEVRNQLARMGIVANRVTKGMRKLLIATSPFTSTAMGDIRPKLASTTLPDEQLARFTGYTQGKVGRGGTYFGTDIISGYPVFKKFKRSTESAENVLITAETGGGKSFFLKSILLDLTADPRFRGTIMDIEGFEYIPFANFIANQGKVLVINMAEGQGKYFDPVEISLTGEEELDSMMYTFSKSLTTAIMTTLVGESAQQREWVSTIIKDAVAMVYAENGVTDDSSTWGNSRGLRLHDVYHKIRDICTEGINFVYDDKKQYTADEGKYKLESYQEAVNLLYNTLRSYFEPNGLRSSVFKDRIHVNDIRDADLVVCSFGMAGNDNKRVDPIQMALTQMYAASISQVRSLFCKKDGMYHYKVWEEFQRWGTFPGSRDIINTALTGGRKLGDTNFISTNKLSELLNNDALGILENIQTIAIGAINDADVRRGICERLSIEDLQGELDTIAANKGDLSTYNEQDKGYEQAYAGVMSYRHAFLCKLDNIIPVITKMILPDEVARSDLFRTGIDIKG